MAKVEGDQEAQGIKLFGKTIVLQVKEEATKGATTHDNKSGEQASLEKRPDKIIPCPRCKSMETKFCYFNNYNVNQPRHFCKGCQRYWTAGGALRNVPVGAGRRRAKLPGRPSMPGAYPENCVFDVAGTYHFDQFVDGVEVEEYWAHHPQLVATARGGGAGGGCGGFNPDSPAKRRRDVSYGQTNC